MAWQKGQSGNPAGRPKGITDRRVRILRALEPDLPQLLRTLMDAALAGDVQAAGLLLSRVIPPLKARGEPVRFAFDASAPMGEQAEAALQAVADGIVPPDTGRLVLESIVSLSQVRALENLEARITALEADSH
ncbi:MAG: hypothetical protein IT469_11780 [Pseudomonadales bacterium]|nr:hypothetical protein [Pseudomonadales bacterium]